MKLQFSSDTGFALFTDQLDLRYPSNLVEVDKDALTVEFNGDEPGWQLKRFAEDHGGYWL